MSKCWDEYKDMVLLATELLRKGNKGLKSKSEGRELLEPVCSLFFPSPPISLLRGKVLDSYIYRHLTLGKPALWSLIFLISKVRYSLAELM